MSIDSHKQMTKAMFKRFEKDRRWNLITDESIHEDDYDRY